MRNPARCSIVALFCTVVCADSVFGNLIVNGDFEAAPYNNLGTVTGWTVSGTGNVVSAAQGATSGTHSAALSATVDSQGDTLSQSFVTTAGRVYSLDFDAGVFGTPNSTQTLRVQVIGSFSLLDVTFAPAAIGTFDYTRTVFDHHHYTFTADSAVTTLQFTDIGTGNGAADTEVDTVVVTEHKTNRVATYSVRELGTLGTGDNSVASGMNFFGQVTGGSNTMGNNEGHAFLSEPNGGAIRDLGTLGGNFSNASGVNDSGQVAGYGPINGDSSPYHAFLSGPNGGPLHDLGTNGGTDSYADAVNASGQVLGAYVVNGIGHAFLSGPNGAGFTDIPTPGPVLLNGVNDSGQVTGYYSTTNSPSHAYLTAPNGGSLTDLGTLGGTNSVGFGVNASGQVTGWAHYTDNYEHAFLTGPNGANLIDIGSFGDSTEGHWVNTCGQVVGRARLPNLVSYPYEHAFIYYPTGGIQDLNSRLSPATGFVVVTGQAINDQGQVTGTGVNGLGHDRAFFLTPNLGIDADPDNNVVLFWPGSCNGPTLQKATRLTGTGNWADVTDQPSIVDGASELTVTPSPNNSRGFYRLVFITGPQNQLRPGGRLRAGQR